MGKQFLSSEALSYLGLCDEFYDLYISICDIFNESIEKEISITSSKGCVSISKIEAEIKPSVRKALDDFLGKYTYIFTAEYMRLHPNSPSMRLMMNVLNVKFTDPFTLEISMASFSKFLKIFEEFILRILLQRKAYDYKTITYDTVRKNVSKHFEGYVNSYLHDIKTKEPPKESKLHELIVFKNLSGISCNLESHLIRSEVLQVPLLDSDEYVLLSVHNCASCGRKFIGNETLKIYEKIFGKMIVSIRSDIPDAGNNTNSYNIFSRFCIESELHRAGYNVAEGKLTKNERRKLLIKLYELGFFDDFKIKRDIENAIQLFEGRERYARAVEKWQSDLLFISEYIKENS